MASSASIDTPKLIFLVPAQSRLLRRPVSLVLRGLSAAGKSYAVESVVLPFFSPSAYFDRSGMSAAALVYSDESSSTASSTRRGRRDRR